MQIDISKKLYGRKVGLKDIHLYFPQGKTTLIIGTSGAGKSTLIKCIIQETSFDGTVQGYKKEDIAYIPQHPALNKNETVYNAIYWSARFAYTFQSGRKLHALTQEYIDKVGLNTVQNNRIQNLSGGQVQRVSIAKELIRGKSIVIADEIDTGLDCGVAKSLIQMLSNITHRENKTAIIISHNLVNVDMYDNVVVLVKDSNHTGRVAYAGNPQQAKRHFDVSEYVDILVNVNSPDEGGLGLAEKYIAKFRSYRD